MSSPRPKFMGLVTSAILAALGSTGGTMRATPVHKKDRAPVMSNGQCSLNGDGTTGVAAAKRKARKLRAVKRARRLGHA